MLEVSTGPIAAMACDLFGNNPDSSKPSPNKNPRTPYTDDERIAVECLRHVGMPAASWDKRFRNQLSDDGATAKERPQIWRLFIRYRRQFSHPRKAELLAIAERLAAPDFRKQQAIARDRQRLAEYAARAGL